MAFNKKIKLLKVQTGNGSQPDRITAQKNVWADVEDVGVTTQFAAEAAGKVIDLQATLFRREYAGGSWTHAEYKGKRFKIESDGRAANDLHIKLMLSGR